MGKSRHPCDPSVTKQFLAQLQSIGVLPEDQTLGSSNSSQSNAATSSSQSSTDGLAQLTQHLQSMDKSRHPCDPSIAKQFLAQLQSIGVLPEDQTQKS